MDITQAICSPLRFIDLLHQDATQEETSQGESLKVEESISRSFRSLLINDDSVYQIPSITHPLTSPESLPRESLVRFRCMIQDTGLGPELYSSQDSAGRCMMYRESNSCSNVDPVDTYNHGMLSERELYYGVEIPGEASWVQSALDGSPERGLEYAINKLDMVGNEAEPEGFHKADVSTLEGTRDKYPIRGKKHVGALLKIYDPSDNQLIKTSDVIEVIGILDWTPFLSENHHENLVTGQTNGNNLSATSSIPCVHVVFCRTPPLPLLEIPNQQAERRIIIDRLLNYLSNRVFKGDDLAAQYLLASIAAKIHTRLNGFTIGALPLNLIYQDDSDSASCLSEVLSSILPRSLMIPLTIVSLNQAPLFPVSNESSLHSGPLQLSPDTTLVIDSRKMSEGQLNSMGIKNISALKKVVNDGKLMYSFPYSTFEFDVEIGIVTLSEGCKTFLEGFWPLPIHHPKSHDATPCSEPTAEELSIWRGLIQDMRKRPIIIPESLSSEIQEAFVSIRKTATTLTDADKAMSQEDLSQRLQLARLLGLRLGKDEVDLDDWQQACKLEKLRKIRLSTK
ncbi:hypothetical protein PGT21_026497 [Puccinia graminis f. sp. tritici]|uniref:Mini-chromosome maintenance complex-binding protein n=1 Tax=Puccinia graminis f. sp. tritici TaxID=56615 RepID=A0A5B0LVE8_PUCGR|nr:hypothetical protein PGTUg99_013954 [Puccinia graminis f. sp. tritici]KAA1104546.1 hypothetical protein PGT21_026497 [Puccinia graminis f. sp. tritici]